MKKAISASCLILCIVLCFGLLAGCGSSTDTPSQSPATSSNESQSPSTSTSPAPTTSTAPASPTVPSTPPPIVESPEPPPPDVEFYDALTVSIGDRVTIIDVFNPAFSNSQIQLVTNMIHDYLIYVTMESTIQPYLAYDWKTDDYQHWTFYLRDDVFFHNGEKFTADDVAFTIDTSRESPGSSAESRYRQIESYEIVNDYEIIFTLEKVNVDFLYDMAYSSIVNRKAYADDPVKGAWVGTGKYTVTDFLSNDYVEFTRNENYWGELPPTRKITFKYIAEETARLIMFDNDQLDFCNIPSAYLSIYESDPDYTLVSYTMNNSNFFAFNMDNPILADINFRMACAYAFNPFDCVAISLGGNGVAMDWGTLWGYRIPYKDMDIPRIPYDPEIAKEYLAKSSYNGEEIELVAGMQHTIMNAQVVQSQLTAIGINARVYDTDGATLSSYTLAGSHQIVVNSAVWTIPNSVRNIYYPGMVGNVAHYNNPRVNELLDLALITGDGPERESIYREIQEIAAQDLPYIGIFHMTMVIGGRAGTGGLLPYPNNNHDWSMVYRIKQ